MAAKQNLTPHQRAGLLPGKPGRHCLWCGNRL